MRLILARMIWNFDLELQDSLFEPEQQHVYNFWQKPALNVRVIKCAESKRPRN
jgi:hypothetical protein